MSGEEAGPSAAGGRDGKGAMGGREEENIGREGKTGASDPVYVSSYCICWRIHLFNMP